VLTHRRAIVRLRREARVLPRPVARFYRRAQAEAVRAGDRFSLDSATRPAELAWLIELAAGRRQVVELGTATAWTTIALALADAQRRVVSYDPVVHEHREGYLALIDPGVRARITLRQRTEADGPEPGDAAVDMLFVDSTHDRDSVLRTVSVWQPVLAPGAVVAFHDYDHPEYPGVREAIEELGLPGESSGGLFVWRP
jgi:predicted O-methyltransferase YrrM